MENQRENGLEAMKSSVLNCIDLSNPDINQSVSLLKQVPLNYSKVIGLLYFLF